MVTDAVSAAKRLHEKLNAGVVLKGTCSVLCAETLGLNPYGTPAMAKGGSGDALTGILTALLAGRAAGAYDMSDLEVMQTACALHGLAGEMAARQMGERGMLATDLCRCIGRIAIRKPNVHEKTDAENSHICGRKVTVIVEHGAGTRDPDKRSFVYRRSLGYVQEVLHERNEWQDACILGVKQSVEWFEGVVCGVARAGGRSVWCVCASGVCLTEETIRQEISFLGEVEEIRLDC